MIGAGEPKGSIALHAMKACHDILDRKHGGVTQMERPGHIGRWKYDGKGRGVWYGEAFLDAGIRVKEATLFPSVVNGVFVVFGFVGCRDFRFHMGKW